MTHKQRLSWYLRQEITDAGLSWSEAKQAARTDERVIRVIGKLLVEFPVSFNIEFIAEELDIPADKGPFARKAKEMYVNSLRKRA